MKKMIYNFLFILSLTVLEAQVDFESQIQTIFNYSCTGCHGNSGGLNLTTYSGVMTGGNTGAAIVAGDHASSLLWVRVENGSMPPSGTLSSDQVDLIAQWIDEGALETPAVESENLFFSEWAEGTSYNKYIEIYNATGEEIDLSNYKVSSCANGCDTSGEWDYPDQVVFDAGTMLASGDVFVLAHPSADPIILDHADDVSFTYMGNGNDAFGLVEVSTGSILDIVGDMSSNAPDIAWDVAGVTNATKEHTIVRKATVISGNTDWAASAGTTADDSEWIVFEQNNWDNLGFHVYGTGGANLNPNANAGSNQTVALGSIVTLNGSGSYDTDGTIASYEWTQSAGSTVELSSTTLPEVTFTAPSSEDSLSFTLIVTDDDGAIGTATVFVKTVQGVSNAVFFSEWAEGTSYNKYIEIYNGTGEEIDLGNYKVSSCSNGCNSANQWDYPDQVVFDAGTMLASGDVFVLAHPSADPIILDHADDVSFTYMSNGNDAFGLVSSATGLIVDIIGDMRLNFDPDDFPAWSVAGVENATKEHTIVRKPSVIAGNTDWASSAGTDASDSEWIVFEQNNWDNLGSHSQAVDAPLVAFNSIAPVFITEATEIEFTASITTPVGTVSSAVVKYGTSGQLVNESELYLESGDIWAGTIPAQQGNIVLQMRVHATNSEGTEGQSVIEERIIASSTPNIIADLYSSQSINEIVTVKGIVTIGGGGLLYPTQTKAYVQDQSGRGLQLFDYELIDGIERGDEIEVVGYTGYYNTTYQIKDFEYRELSSGNDLPDPIVVTPSGANSSDYEGTLISVTGNVTVVTPVSTTGTNLTIDDVTSIMLWNSTGIDVSSFVVGYRGQFIGIGSQYNDQYQLLVGYQTDITTVVAVDGEIVIADRFDLMPAYPNPFNPSTKLSFSIDTPSELKLEVYDVSGKLIETVAKGFYQSGSHMIQWNASEHSSGMYFVYLVKGSEMRTQKVMLLK